MLFMKTNKSENKNLNPIKKTLSKTKTVRGFKVLHTQIKSSPLGEFFQRVTFDFNPSILNFLPRVLKANFLILLHSLENQLVFKFSGVFLVTLIIKAFRSLLRQILLRKFSFSFFQVIT